MQPNASICSWLQDSSVLQLQRAAAIRNLSYTDRLITVGLPSLELRRLQIDLIYCYKIVFGQVIIKQEGIAASWKYGDADTI